MRQFMNIVGKLTEAHGIEGLPADVRIQDRSLNDLIGSGRFRLQVVDTRQPSRFSSTDLPTYIVRIEHDDVDRGTVFGRRRGRPTQLDYHDPDLSDVHHHDAEDDILHHAFAKPKPGLSDEIEPLGAGVIYRGMSHEEYEGFVMTGRIISIGAYNIGKEQEGLTYWTTDPDTAVSYANSFAPTQFKATFRRPSYVVAAKAPDPADTRRVAGTGSHEVGVARAITADEIVAVWQGRVYVSQSGQFDLRPDYNGNYSMGGGGMPSSGVVWQRIA